MCERFFGQTLLNQVTHFTGLKAVRRTSFACGMNGNFKHFSWRDRQAIAATETNVRLLAFYQSGGFVS